MNKQKKLQDKITKLYSEGKYDPESWTQIVGLIDSMEPSDIKEEYWAWLERKKQAFEIADHVASAIKLRRTARGEK